MKDTLFNELILLKILLEKDFKKQLQAWLENVELHYILLAICYQRVWYYFHLCWPYVAQL